jgi:hypothetical protein
MPSKHVDIPGFGHWKYCTVPKCSHLFPHDEALNKHMAIQHPEVVARGSDQSATLSQHETHPSSTDRGDRTVMLEEWMEYVDAKENAQFIPMCEDCGKDGFESEAGLRDHRIVEHVAVRKDIARCDHSACGLDFDSKAGLKDHMFFVHGVPGWLCMSADGGCSLRFSTRERRDQHREQAHQVDRRVHICYVEDCGTALKTSVDLKAHLEAIHGGWSKAAASWGCRCRATDCSEDCVSWNSPKKHVLEIHVRKWIKDHGGNEPSTASADAPKSPQASRSSRSKRAAPTASPSRDDLQQDSPRRSHRRR